MPSASKTNKPAHITTGDIFDDLGLTYAETLEAKIKADLWRDLVAHIEQLGLKQKALALRLGVHQPDVSNLLSGKISKFGVGTLIQYAVRLDLSVSVKLTAPKAAKIPSLKASATVSSRRVTHA